MGDAKGIAKRFLTDESGMGTVEVILIIVVLIGLVIVFKKQINDLVTKIFKKITTDSNKIIGLGEQPLVPWPSIDRPV